MTASTSRTHPKTCNLCEAMCGLRIDVQDGRVQRIRADPDDPLSRGAICPKAIGLAELQDDPDRLREPVRRDGAGRHQKISWDEALDETASRIAAIQARDGDDAAGLYLGNPGAHNFGTVMYLAGLTRALGTRNRYSASSLDQNPRHAASLLMFGNFLSIPVPDVDHTDFLLMLGANPLVSNGSLMSAPGFRRRLRALRERGGRFVVVDPRRSETAEVADLHLAIEPGRDPLLLAALVHTVIEEGIGRKSHLEAWIDGRAAFAQAVAPFRPEAVEADLGIPAAELRALAREFAAAPSAACYGRIGTCVGPYGTLASWLIDVLNLLTGNLDRVGGSMLPTPAVDLAAIADLRGTPGRMGELRTRVRGAPEFNDERPAACLAEEILEPGPGRLRGMLTIAGNPCLSAPGGGALDRAFATLEFYAAIDFYVNETTRHADIILPPTASLEHDNYEVLFHQFAVRDTARYSPVVIAPGPEQRDDWWILSQLALRIAEKRASSASVRRALRVARRFVPGPRRVLDWALRLGPRGDGFRPWRQGLRLRDLEAHPSGLDLGPLAPSLGALLTKRGQRLDLAPAVMLDELRRLAADRAAIAREADELLLIGRRDMRTNNSWFHNLPLSIKGPDRCTLHMHPDDARRRGLVDGDRVCVRNRVGRIETRLVVRDALRPGVVSLPHGWGHGRPGSLLERANRHPGVNCNQLTDPEVIEPVVGNAVFNGVPVRVEAL